MKDTSYQKTEGVINDQLIFEDHAFFAQDLRYDSQYLHHELLILY